MAINVQALDDARRAILETFAWTRSDFDFSVPVGVGTKGPAADRVQELLGANGHHVTIDGDYGTATRDAVADLQRSAGLNATGDVDDVTRLALLAPMLRAADPRMPGAVRFDEALRTAMRRHLESHPVEIGGDNRGPWVRLYCQGKDGKSFLWCAGFVSFLLLQAAKAVGAASPLGYTLSCDNLAGDAKTKGRFVAGNGRRPVLEPPAVFLVRKTATDWIHTGLVASFDADSFSTAEGNTNEAGGSNGFEACARRRGYESKDFIRILPP